LEIALPPTQIIRILSEIVGKEYRHTRKITRFIMKLIITDHVTDVTISLHATEPE
jgi:hypothetical protein